jgi:hypothetical protein
LYAKSIKAENGKFKESAYIFLDNKMYASMEQIPIEEK